jgi:hypothetical protein
MTGPACPVIGEPNGPDMRVTAAIRHGRVPT